MMDNVILEVTFNRIWAKEVETGAVSAGCVHVHVRVRVRMRARGCVCWGIATYQQSNFLF